MHTKFGVNTGYESLNFLMGISMLNFKFCIHGFTKSIHMFSLRFYSMHVHFMLFTWKEFGFDPLKAGVDLDFYHLVK